MKSLHSPGTTNSPYLEAPDEIVIEGCPDSSWLIERLELIDPHIFESGNDGAYTRALERLAIQQRDELAIATHLAKAPAPCTGSGCACKHKGQAYCEKHDS